MTDVFISYSRKDKEFAHRLDESLNHNMILAFVYSDLFARFAISVEVAELTLSAKVRKNSWAC
jgi:hypothetical protein